MHLLSWKISVADKALGPTLALRAAGLFGSEDDLSEWIELFKEKFITVPDDRTLQIVDAHS